MAYVAHIQTATGEKLAVSNSLPDVDALRELPKHVGTLLYIEKDASCSVCGAPIMVHTDEPAPYYCQLHQPN